MGPQAKAIREYLRVGHELATTARSSRERLESLAEAVSLAWPNVDGGQLIRWGLELGPLSSEAIRTAEWLLDHSQLCHIHDDDSWHGRMTSPDWILLRTDAAE